MPKDTKKNTDSGVSSELAKLRSLSWTKRWEYIWDYYKLPFFLILFFLFFLGSLGTFLVKGALALADPKESFSMGFAAPGFTGNDQWTQECLSAIGYQEENETFQLLVTKPLSDSSDDFRINAAVWLGNGQPDIFVVNEAGFRHLQSLEALANLTETWPEALQTMASGKLEDPYRLEISDTAFARAFAITDEPVYLCMYQDGFGFQRALDIVEYILAEG